jgi:SAM-dependent methyltransferase
LGNSIFGFFPLGTLNPNPRVFVDILPVVITLFKNKYNQRSLTCPENGATSRVKCIDLPGFFTEENEMNTSKQSEYIVAPGSPIFDESAFSRLDPTEDRVFYTTDRFVNHLDSLALSAVEKIIGTLLIEDHPHILDLMAGWDSHIPDTLRPARVIGLGLNETELKKNKNLTGYVLHDLNTDPRLPFPENSFDTVLNTVSVDYMTHPMRVFQEVGRILKPGGLFLVIFSNRMFLPKAVKVWRESNEEERIILVEEFFKAADCFERPSLFVSKGRPRPKDDKYASMKIPSDPVYALYADKKGGDPSRSKRPAVVQEHEDRLTKEELEDRKKGIKMSLCCPHCGERLKKWIIPDNPFGCTWDNEYMYICFNDECPYFVRGWEFMQKEGNSGSYRLMYNPEKDTCQPLPVPTARALRESLVD